MEALQRTVEKRIIQLGKELTEGKIDVLPARQRGSGQYSACTWCEYSGVCGFDEKIPGYSMRNLELEDDDAKEIIVNMYKEK